jgi:transcriptional regulator with XRE-family HTH domain
LPIRKARTRRGLSQEALAHLIGRSAGWMLQVENGTADPLHSDLVNIAGVVGVQLSDIVANTMDDEGVLSPGPPAPAPYRAAADVLLDAERLHHVRQRPASIDGQVLDQVAALTRSYWQTYHTTDPTLLLPVVSAHVAQLRLLVDESMPTGVARRLRSLTADAASLVGWLALRLENRATSAIYWALAESLAGEADDQALRCFTLVSRSSLHSGTLRGEVGGDSTLAVAYVEAGSVPAPEVPPVQLAWTFSRRAEEYAGRGDAAAAQHDLDNAATYLGQVRGRPDGYFAAWNRAQLDGYRGSCATALGSRHAVIILESSLASTDSSLGSQRTAILANLGAAHARLGQVDDACHALANAITIAGRSNLAVSIRRVRGVRARLEQWSGAPSVRRLDEQIASLP